MTLYESLKVAFDYANSQVDVRTTSMFASNVNGMKK